MHSMMIAAMSLILAISSAAGFGSSVESAAMMLAVAVAVIGVPHGALDPVVGRRLMQPLCNRWWLPFFGGYLTAAAIVVLGWYVAPVSTCAVFFGLAAWHFGLEEDYATPLKADWAKQLFAIARGSTIIWATCLFRHGETQAILLQVMPNGSLQEVRYVMEGVRAAAFIFVPIAAIDLIAWSTRAKPGRLAAIVRTVSIVALAALANPLVSFGVYFCGWHSMRGLRELRAERREGLRAFVLRLVPLTTATLLLAAVGFAGWSSLERFTPSVIRTVFVGLSAIAIPHLALHTWRRLAENSPTVGGSMKGIALCN
jgi:Brp/Blh family beta-carotene 15,15'-monooxygenase